MIKAVIFDVFGVLVTDTWQKFLDNLPADADIQNARKARRAYDGGLIGKVEFAQQIQAATGRKFLEIEDIDDEGVIKNTRLLDYIDGLRKQGLKTAILSNAASSWVKHQFLTPQEAGYFNEIVLSFELGMIKPERESFEYTAKRLGVNLDEMVLVDDKERYCAAARGFGMKAVMYEDFEQAKADLEVILKS